MLKKVYSIKDVKSGIYNVPFYKTTHGEAERDFKTLANDEKSMLNKYPEDFELYYIGEYDDNTGRLTSVDTPMHIISGPGALATRQ